VAERVRRPRHRRSHAQRALEVAETALELPHEHLGRRQIGVGLHEVAADDIPAALRHLGADARECLRVGALDVFVDRRLAAHEGQLRKLVHQIQHGPARAEAFVQPLAPIPQPDRIEVGVGDDVKAGHARGSIRSPRPAKPVQPGHQ